MSNNPTQCPKCGCTVLKRTAIASTCKVETYFGGTLRKTVEFKHKDSVYGGRVGM
ncbi:MAG: hypothetical protein PVI90_00510 [Desulfobacteraceae bacterium]|jgi:hypothetical protein